MGAVVVHSVQDFIGFHTRLHQVSRPLLLGGMEPGHRKYAKPRQFRVHEREKGLGSALIGSEDYDAGKPPVDHH